jgi:putative restriction endonuclease
LLKEFKETEKAWGEFEDLDKKQKIRDQGFRKVITQLYDHRCALCGIRMLTPEGHTIVEAAHIKPWHKSYDDRPTNGLALCRLYHWSFDEGLMSVGRNYEVLVSKRIRTDRNIPGHMMTLSDRPIFKPQGQNYWPAQTNIEWHRKLVYRK